MPKTPVGLDRRGLCTDCKVDVQFGDEPGATARREEWIDSEDRRQWEMAHPGRDATRALVYGEASS